MSMANTLLGIEAPPEQVVRGNVLGVGEDGAVTVDCPSSDSDETLCQLLHTSETTRLQLTRGDRVLVWLPADEGQDAVVLGRIGPSRAPAQPTQQTDDIPDELVIEARENLTFKCGEGSITLRADGKILIRGKDLVSRAQRLNRIQGGAVAIN